jgi:hypothetical protein
VASIISRDGGPASAARAAKMRSNTPADEAIVERFVRPVGRRCVSPLQAVADDIDDPAQHTAVVHPWDVPCESGKCGDRRCIWAVVSRNGGLGITAPPPNPDSHHTVSLQEINGS